MDSRRVFRDFKVLVVATGLHQERLRSILEAMGFARIVVTDQDKQAPGLIRKSLPQLVVSNRNMPVFSGAQLVYAARDEEPTQEIPFLILGAKEDLAPGGLAEKIRAKGRAELIAEPFTEDGFARTLVELLEPDVDPDRENAYGRKDEALEAVKNNDQAGAEKLFRESLDSFPGDPDCWLDLAKSLVTQEKFDQAEEAYLKTLELDSGSLKAFLGLAELYEKQDQNELAVDVLSQALSIAQSLELKGSSKARLHFYLGEFELRLQRLGKAQEAFAEAIQNDPENAQLRAQIGDSYLSQGRYEESEGHYQAALRMDPDMAHTYNRLGMAYRKQGKFGRALKLYEQARTRHPEDEHLLFNMARTHYELGDTPSCISLLNEALTLDPGFNMARLLLTKVIAEKTGTAAKNKA